MQSAQIIRNGRRLIASRDKILAGQGGQLREVIAASWQRSIAHGLLPDVGIHVFGDELLFVRGKRRTRKAGVHFC